jgi:hypothetical protein
MGVKLVSGIKRRTCRRLNVFENMVLRGIFAPKRVETLGE